MAYTRSHGSIYLLSTESGQAEADKIVNVRARVCLKYRPISRPDKVWARRRRVDFISFIFLKQEVDTVDGPYMAKLHKRIKFFSFLSTLKLLNIVKSVKVHDNYIEPCVGVGLT